MAINQKYSFKDFKGVDFSGVSADEFNGQGDIVGSCFYQVIGPEDAIPSSGGKKIFPAGMTGVTFKRCNLDNVELPAGNTVTSDGGVNSTQRTIKEMNDRENWEMEFKTDSWFPKVPVSEALYDELGVSKDPANIPGTRVDKSPIQIAKEAL